MQKGSNGFLKIPIIISFLCCYLLVTQCKKADLKVDNSAETNFSERFFQVTTEPNDEVAYIIELLKAENEKTNFVKKLPKNCGLPVWEKLILFNETPNDISYSRSSHGPSANFENFTTGTTYVTIPLTSTGSSLSSIINVTLNNGVVTTDCVLSNGYLYNVTHGNSVDTTQAANAMNLFFYMENRTFGATKFYNIPSILFPQTQQVDAAGNKTIQISGDTTITGNVAPIQWICLEYFNLCNICNQNPCSLGNSYSYTLCTPIGGGGWWTGGGESGGTGGGNGGGGSGGGSPINCITPWYSLENNCSTTNNGLGLIFNNLSTPISVPQQPAYTVPGLTIEPIPPSSQPAIRRLARVDPRGNTEDMEYGYDGDGTGIVPIFLTLTDEQLFTSMTTLFDGCTVFDASLKSVGHSMIQKFRNSTGGQYTDPVLNTKVNSSSEFKTFMTNFGVTLNNKLEHAGWNIDNVAEIIIPQAQRLRFSSTYHKFNGLQILMNDTEATDIEINGFSIHPTTHNWTANLTVTVYDHFGLDKNDALTYQQYSGGFASWWVLQKKRNYRPFETVVKISVQLVCEPNLMH
jgi:hypothetical protein